MSAPTIDRSSRAPTRCGGSAACVSTGSRGRRRGCWLVRRSSSSLLRRAADPRRGRRRHRSTPRTSSCSITSRPSAGIAPTRTGSARSSRRCPPCSPPWPARSVVSGSSSSGAAVVGFFLQKLLEIMVQRRFPSSSARCCSRPSPAIRCSRTRPPRTCGVPRPCVLRLGITDIARFISWGSTQAGFRAGLLLMLAVLSDISALLYVGAAAPSVPSCAWPRGAEGRSRSESARHRLPDRRRARSDRLAQPHLPRPAARHHRPSSCSTARAIGSPRSATLHQPSGWLLLASVASAWLVALLVRRPAAIFVSTLVFAAILGAFVLGLLPWARRATPSS